MLLDYLNYNLYYCNKETGEIVSVAEDIYQRILDAKMQNTRVHIMDADKQDPKPETAEIWPPKSEREYNNIYYIVKSRSTTTVEE